MKRIERIKKTIIESLNDGWDYVEYQDGQEYLLDDSDWQDIANVIGNTLYYDVRVGTYTMEGYARYFKTVEPE